MQFIDTHIHLQDFKSNCATDIVGAARRAGVAGMVCVSSYPEDWERAAALALSFPGYVVPAFGLHPWYLEKAETLLSEYLQRFPQALLGECGLDRLKNSAYEPQAEVFACQIELAVKYGRPLIVHAVRADAWLEGFWAKLPPKFVFHSFSGSREQLNKIMSRGGYVGFNYSVLRSRHRENVLKSVPAERMLLETDGPYQGPLRGEEVASSALPELTRRIAAVRGCAPEMLAGQVYRSLWALENRRFLRTEVLLGHEGMERLRGARVMVVGLGAVGGYALEALARAGVGHLTLVDFDVFDESNINRQILALSSTVGRKKTEVARERVLDINPDCDVKIIETFVNADTLPQLLAEPVDYVVDAIDALNPKCCLMEMLYRNGIPFISSMGAALKTDVSRIGLRRLSRTENCSLARFVRKRLKRRGVDIGKIVCVSSDEQVKLPATALFDDNENDANPVVSGGRNGRKRLTMGSLPTVTAVFGLTIAGEIIKNISRRADSER